MQVLASVSKNYCFSGVQHVFEHDSLILGCKMKFGLYMPANTERQKIPLFLWLSGLTCTHENFVTKSGIQGIASRHGVCVLAPDTSPRGIGISGEDDSWDFGTGAGFYLDATNSPWDKNYKMESYLVQELIPLVLKTYPELYDQVMISGHSMGGHGALTLGLNYPHIFGSVTAFSPICAPIRCPWGQKAFSNYLGEDKTGWARYDTCELITSGKTTKPILIDQGLSDNFLQEQLKPELLEESLKHSTQKALIRRHENYDHSYYFVSTFLEEHLLWHLKNLDFKP
ncbi:MAG: S-formylglutathione hydrolase [Candidatus Cloacimonetes bacterium]|nr:S-formylglutathione hydrolase [Candidatus Cloacimonadota bacterium]